MRIDKLIKDLKMYKKAYGNVDVLMSKTTAYVAGRKTGDFESFFYKGARHTEEIHDFDLITVSLEDGEFFNMICVMEKPMTMDGFVNNLHDIKKKIEDKNA